MVKRLVDHPNPKTCLQEYVSLKKVTTTRETLVDITKRTKDFLDFVNKDLDKLTEKDLSNYLFSLKDKYSIGSQNAIKATLKHFVKWNYPNYSSEFRNLDKLCRSQKSEKPYSPKDMITRGDVEKLVKCEETVFWKTFIMILFYGGFRPVEVSRLKWKDISFDKDGLFIQMFSPKNKKTFTKFLPQEVSFYLKKLQDNNSEWVFPSRINKGKDCISKKSFYFKMRTLAPKALGKKVNPYILRHSVATILYNEDGLKDDLVAKQMGHTKDMREVYDNLDIKKLKEKMKKIWISPEDLPVEKKHELEKRIELLENKLNESLKIHDETQTHLKTFRDIFQGATKEEVLALLGATIRNMKKEKKSLEIKIENKQK